MVRRKVDTGAAADRAARARRDRQLFLRCRAGDGAAREALVERFLPLARQLARRYQRGGEPLDDLYQVASLGLIKAIDRFDVSRETAFSTFAVPTILGELKRHFRVVRAGHLGPRPRGSAAALPGGSHAVGDRNATGFLTDARLTADTAVARHPA